MDLQSSNPKDRIGVTKVPLHLVPASALTNMALAHLDGSLKYGAYNWRSESVAATTYIDAALRHIQKWTHGQEYDVDSGVHNLGHAVACLNILMDCQLSGNMIDDRPPADGSPEYMDQCIKAVTDLLERRGKGKDGQKEEVQPGKDWRDSNDLPIG